MNDLAEQLKLPSPLKIFRTTVFLMLSFCMNKSPIMPDMTMKNQKTIYGKAAIPPLALMSNLRTSFMYKGSDVRYKYVPRKFCKSRVTANGAAFRMSFKLLTPV